MQIPLKIQLFVSFCIEISTKKFFQSTILIAKVFTLQLLNIQNE